MLSLCPIQQEPDLLALMSIHHFWNPLGHLKDGHPIHSTRFPTFCRIRGHTWIDNIEELSKWWHSLYRNTIWTYQEAPSCIFLSDFRCCPGSSFINSPPSRRIVTNYRSIKRFIDRSARTPRPSSCCSSLNACIKSGWACRATLNIKWEILSTYQKRNNISFREVRTAPSKKQSPDWHPEAFYSFNFSFW